MQHRIRCVGVYEFKNLRCMMNDRGTKKVGCKNKRVAWTIKALISNIRLSLEGDIVLRENLLILTQMYKRKEKGLKQEQ